MTHYFVIGLAFGLGWSFMDFANRFHHRNFIGEGDGDAEPV